MKKNTKSKIPYTRVKKELSVFVGESENNVKVSKDNFISLREELLFYIKDIFNIIPKNEYFNFDKLRDEILGVVEEGMNIYLKNNEIK